MFDEQLEALDRHLAMGDWQSEMLTPLPSYPIDLPANAQVTDSDRQTSFTRVLQILLGTHETISRSATSGMAAVFLLGVFFAVSVQLDLDVEGLSFLREPGSVNWPGIICGPLLFAIVAGGRPVGWLFIRPIAVSLHLIWPQLNRKAIWMISTVSICVPFVILALYPYQQLPLLRQIIMVILAAFWATVFGIMAGFLGAVVQTKHSRKEWVEDSAIGSSVTGGLWVSLQVLMSLFLSPGIKLELGSVVEGCLLLAGISFISYIPYVLMWPLLVGTSKLIRYGRECHISYVLISGSIWMIIGYLVGTQMLTDTNVIGGFVQGCVMGLCGACGGWTIGEFRRGRD
ncbi:MAG: hypothetical protein JXB07_11195 [Anaerolineae bacterium]|nr:hypothetical protein [Anaerolineae bacterium]